MAQHAFAPTFVRLSELGPSAIYRLALTVLWLWMEIGERRAATSCTFSGISPGSCSARRPARGRGSEE